MAGPLTSADRWQQKYLRHLTIERGRSRNTVAAYERDLNQYLEFLALRGVTEPEDVTTDVMAEYRRELAALPSAATIARKLSSVKGFHKFLLEEGVIDVDVAAEQKPPKLPSRLPKAISTDQMATLLAATDGDELTQLRDKALLELLYATGARVGEAAALNVDDVLDSEVVRLFGKGAKQRIVPLGSFARQALATYLVRARPALSAKGKATPALFLGVRGARLSRQSIWLIIQETAERAELGVEVSPHTFRHSFATHLLAGGADVRVVQELLGHSSVTTTQIYTHVTGDRLRDMYSQAHPRAR